MGEGKTKARNSDDRQVLNPGPLAVTPNICRGATILVQPGVVLTPGSFSWGFRSLHPNLGQIASSLCLYACEHGLFLLTRWHEVIFTPCL